MIKAEISPHAKWGSWGFVFSFLFGHVEVGVIQISSNKWGQGPDQGRKRGKNRSFTRKENAGASATSIKPVFIWHKAVQKQTQQSFLGKYQIYQKALFCLIHIRIPADTFTNSTQFYLSACSKGTPSPHANTKLQALKMQSKECGLSVTNTVSLSEDQKQPAIMSNQLWVCFCT